jgi:hypothetical protein
MWQYAAKVALSALVIVAVSEIAKRSSFWAAALASLSLTSLLAFVWLHVETGDAERIASLSQDILWLVLPSLVLFVVLPILLRAGWSFWPSLAASSAATACAYAAMVWVMSRAGIDV